MSEYQCYEFVALDRPLSKQEMGELRAISTRAEITPTRFWNEYHWGDLKANPADLLARYFDAYLYFANWGTHRFMLRLPAARVDQRALRAYFPGGPARLTKVGSHLVLDLWSDTEQGEEEEWFEGGRLAALTPLRASLLQGNFAAAYLAWLLAVQEGEVADAALEPPVPAGLGNLSAPLSAFAEFLRVDPDLVQAAAEASPEHDLDHVDVKRWVKALSTGDKERWLMHAIAEPEQPLGSELIAAYRRHRARESATPVEHGSRRVAELQARADQLRQAREAEEARRAERERAKAEAQRRTYLDGLAQQEDQAWIRLDTLVSDRKYDEAVQLTVDLRDAATRAGTLAQFEAQFAELKKRHGRKRGYLDAVKLKLAGEPKASGMFSMHQR